MTLLCGLEGGEAERGVLTGLLRNIGRRTGGLVDEASWGGASLADEAMDV